MSEETTPSQVKPSAVIEPTASHDVTLNRRYIIIGCAVGLCVCFFLPWINLFVVAPSGLDLAKGAGNAWLFFGLPIFAIFAFTAAVTGKGYTFPALLAGLTPFAILLYGLNQTGSGIFQSLAVGAWISLGLGIALFLAALK